MVFVRIKKVKGLDYYYLVKSQWDKSRKTSTQSIIKYLGNAHDVTIEDIPLAYRNNPKILSMISLKTQEQKIKLSLTKELKKQIFKSLKNGTIDTILEVAKKYEKQNSLSEFYDDVLKPVMYYIGELWQQNRLDIGTEHVCSNIANQTIHVINELYHRNHKKNSIIICTPEGEIHNIGCNVIESVLLEKGFKVYNISPSVPTDSIIMYIRDTSPSIILISVTLLDNIKSGIRLAKKISSYFNIPIMMGGQAIENSSDKEKVELESVNPNVKMCSALTLKTLPKTIEVLIKNH